MQIQKSFHKESGGLYLVPTPIGNLEDITFRALKILRTANVIAAEDTRNTKRLLNYFEIDTPLISYHEHNKLAREAHLLDRLQAGEMVALVSDAGMPAISDPGYELVHAAIKEDIETIVLPGANAALCALVGSGLATQEFLFAGFLPRKKKERIAALERLKNLQATLLFYESPHRLKETIAALYEVLGDRHASLARELTKKFEEYVRGTLDELVDWTEKEDIRGEFCIVVQGNANPEEPSETTWWEGLSIEAHVAAYIEREGITSKDAIKATAKDRNMPKREVYQIFHVDGEA